jgi:hypothetical protein
MARLFAPFRARGLPILMHSDGQIQQILPDLVEIGLTALNPVQPEVLAHVWLRANFGGLRRHLRPDRAAPRLARRSAPGRGRVCA